MRRSVVGLLFVLVSLTGCTATGVPMPTSSDTETSPATPPTPSVSGSSSEAPEVAVWQPDGAPADPAVYEHPDGGIAFASPSGNIQCGYSEYGSTDPWWWCLLQTQTVVLPADPNGACTGTYLEGTAIIPNGLGVDASDPEAAPQSFCAHAAGAPVLPYGASLAYRDMACDSTEDGMTCRSLVSGKGFRLSRSSYDLY